MSWEGRCERGAGPPRGAQEGDGAGVTRGVGWVVTWVGGVAQRTGTAWAGSCSLGLLKTRAAFALRRLAGPQWAEPEHSRAPASERLFPGTGCRVGLEHRGYPPAPD